MTSDSEIVAAIAAYGDEASDENLATFLTTIGNADGYMLSDGGTPLAPNPRTLKGPDGRTWLAAFSSVERAAKGKPAEDGVLRAPMPLICATARVPGVAGVILNAHDDSATLIEGRSLRAIADMPGSRHPIAMVDPSYPAMLLVRVGRDGAIQAEGFPRTLDELSAELTSLKEQGGIVQYTREAPSEEPTDETSAVIRSVLDLIAGLKLPVSLVEEASAEQVQAALSTRGHGLPWWRRLIGR